MNISQSQSFDKGTILLEEPKGDITTERQGDEDILIAIRKKRQVCVKPVPYAIRNFPSYERVSTS